jgi:Tfp pilus assembly protein PilV
MHPAKKTLNSGATKGFSLVETIVAIFILMIAITGPLSIAYQSIKYARFAGDRAVATLLAQDAMEYIIAKKNYNIESGADWMADLDPQSGQKPCRQDELGCTIDTTTSLSAPGIDKCLGTGCPPLKHNGQSYVYSSGNDTFYTRTIYIETPASNPDERIIRVVVDYSSGIFTNTYEIRLNVFRSNV